MIPKDKVVLHPLDKDPKGRKDKKAAGFEYDEDCYNPSEDGRDWTNSVITDAFDSSKFLKELSIDSPCDKCVFNSICRDELLACRKFEMFLNTDPKTGRRMIENKYMRFDLDDFDQYVPTKFFYNICFPNDLQEITDEYIMSFKGLEDDMSSRFDLRVKYGASIKKGDHQRIAKLLKIKMKRDVNRLSITNSVLKTLQEKGSITRQEMVLVGATNPNYLIKALEKKGYLIKRVQKRIGKRYKITFYYEGKK